MTTNGIVRKNGRLVMGAGIAYEAVLLHPGIDAVLGTLVREQGNRPFLLEEFKIITLPTKQAWWKPSELDFVELSIRRMAELVEETPLVVNPFVQIAMPKPGCGNGGLKWADVEPICDKYLDSRYVVVEK